MKKYKTIPIRIKIKKTKRNNLNLGSYSLIGTNKNANHKKLCIIIISILLYTILFILLFYFFKIKNNANDAKVRGKDFIYEPILPLNREENSIKSYSKSEINFNNIRYNFKDSYNKRKLFKINYSYIPYTKIDKSLSYDENAAYIYSSTGMLNITKLDYYYSNIDINTLNFNHIHLSMGFDNNYIELSAVSIASILNTSNVNTYIHFHITAINFNFEDMKKIINLKKINKNVEFVFYNSIQAEYDFGERAKTERRGTGEYTRILAPQIVNNTNTILILDSGDIIVHKDISEIFYYDLKDNYFAWILDDNAGNYLSSYSRFFRNNFYPNTGVCLVNVRLFRKDELYKAAFFASKAYKNIPCPMQDIFIAISKFKMSFMPLKYNAKLFFESDEQLKNRQTDNNLINRYTFRQRFSQFKYSVDEILEASLDPVISHIYYEKITKGIGCNKLTLQWINYVKLTGFYDKIKQQYPTPFRCEISV